MKTLSRKPVLKLNQPNDFYKFQPLPAPSGKFPYRLSADRFIKPNSEQLVFHMLGDTGSIKNPYFQHKVSAAMITQFSDILPDSHGPQFLYHLGDIVYSYGEAANYTKQFFEPYSPYPGPVFAIAGNHDSDVNPAADQPYHSLDAFKAVFCDSEERQVAFDGSTHKRKSMIQPNVYWTLETPLATIIGLHGNVPKFGTITDEQKNWFINELKYADTLRPNKAIIVCLHNAPYSADTNHGSSLEMITFLERIFAETQIRPDAVFSGHVHNYQRFNKQYPDGKVVPFIVAGAGGYDELHSITRIDDERFTSANNLFDNVVLENFCDNRHGFLKIKLIREPNGIKLYGDYYTLSNDITDDEITLADSFCLDLS